MTREIEIVEEENAPLFYILSEEISGKHEIGEMFIHFRIKPGDIFPNFYKANCHIIEKIGQSKGKMRGLRKEYIGYKTIENISAETLQEIVEGKISLKIVQRN